MRDGSFQVLRRLAQDVQGWRAQVNRARPGGSPADRELLAAKLMGRWASGASLAHHPDADPGQTTPDEDNDFGFLADDPVGETTPTCAHIRKMYPRDSRPPGSQGAAQRRLMRRGIPFGPPFGEADATAARGLVFVCYCASIDAQFEFLQSAWGNNADFPAADDGRDAILGDDAPVDTIPGLIAHSALLLRLYLFLRDLFGHRPAAGGNLVALRGPGGAFEFLNLHRFVETQGAVYSFTPSKAALRQLGAGAV
jgi:Dyp-type peroxidase family